MDATLSSIEIGSTGHSCSFHVEIESVLLTLKPYLGSRNGKRQLFV